MKNNTNQPLYIDLDGTLIRSDTLWDSIAVLLRKRPWLLFLFPLWLWKGRACFKGKLAQYARPQVALLPYREEMVTWLKLEKQDGRRIVLATAAHEKIANRVAQFLGCFDGVLASTTEKNLKGKEKLSAIHADLNLHNEKSFCYAGDCSADIPIWLEAQTGILAGNAVLLKNNVKSDFLWEKEFNNNVKFSRALIRAIRPHQWVKNILIFAPIIAAHKLLDMQLLILAFGTFVTFSFCASSVYLINDLLDLENDRMHQKKKSRPFAAGTLPIPVGILFALILFSSGVALAAWISMKLLAILLIYWTLTCAYSLYLKKIVLLDVFALAVLYSIRAFAGSLLLVDGISHWMMSFLIFFFLSLAFVKRFTELYHLDKEKKEYIKGRGYHPLDSLPVAVFGITSAFVSSLIVSLYITGDTVQALYTEPKVLWALTPLVLFWLSRVWLLAWRGKINQDPVMFALTDIGTYLIGALCAIILFFASR